MVTGWCERHLRASICQHGGIGPLPPLLTASAAEPTNDNASQMPPKSKTGFKWKSILGLGLSGSKSTMGGPSDTRYRDGIGMGTSEQGSHASSTDVALPSPAPRPSPDSTAGQAAVVKHQPSDSGDVEPSPASHTPPATAAPSDSPSPGPLPSPDVLITQPIGGFDPLLGSSGIVLTGVQPSSPGPNPPDLPSPPLLPHLPPMGASPSFFTNANNFQLQNLHYYHQAPTSSSNSPARSDKGQRLVRDSLKPQLSF